MIIPMRCQSCGKPISHKYAEYKKRTAAGEKPAVVLDEVGMKRHCCRAHLMTTVDLLPLAAKYKKF